MKGITECIADYAQKRGITKSQAESEFKTALAVISDACVDGGVSIRGLFTLKRKTVKGREGVVNGVAYKTEDKYSLSFRIGSDLENALNR